MDAGGVSEVFPREMVVVGHVDAAGEGALAAGCGLGDAYAVRARKVDAVVIFELGAIAGGRQGVGAHSVGASHGCGTR